MLSTKCLDRLAEILVASQVMFNSTLKVVIVLLALMYCASDVAAAPGRLYWSERELLPPPIGAVTTIKISELDGSNQQIAPWLDSVERSMIVLDAIGDKLYWADGVDIWRISTDGTEAELVISPVGPLVFDFEVDHVNGKIYIVHGDFEREGKFTRFNLDGTGREELPLFVHQVELDPSHERMYYTVNYAPGVSFFQAALDGTSPTEIFAHPGYPEDFALDPASSKIYWIQSWPGEVLRANIDGSDVETLISDVDGVDFLELDLVHGKMYYAEWNGVTPQFPSVGIRRANLDGSNEEQLTTSPEISGIGIDPFDTTPVPASSAIGHALLLFLVVVSSTIAIIRR